MSWIWRVILSSLSLSLSPSLSPATCSLINNSSLNVNSPFPPQENKRPSTGKTKEREEREERERGEREERERKLDHLEDTVNLMKYLNSPL